MIHFHTVDVITNGINGRNSLSGVTEVNGVKLLSTKCESI